MLKIKQSTTRHSMLIYSTLEKMTGFVSKFDAQAGYNYQNFKVDGNKENYRYNTDTGLRESNSKPVKSNKQILQRKKLTILFRKS